MPDTMEVAITFDNEDAMASIRDVLSDAINAAVDFIVANFQTLVIDPMVIGGKGWRALVDTSSWKWLNSPKGYAQLGFSNALEPLKLLNVLRRSYTVKKVFHFNKRSDSLRAGVEFTWGNLTDIRKATIHPSAGQLNLPPDRSWFDWIYAGAPLREKSAHFKKTGPRKGVRSSSIAGGEAGLMKPGGFWEVSPRFRLDLEKLFERNETKITNTIRDFMQDVIADYLRT